MEGRMGLQAAWTEYQRIRMARTAEQFERRGFAAHVFETSVEAVDWFFSEITMEESIGHGGSDTVRQLGILDRLRSGGFTFLDRYAYGHSYDEQLEIRRRNLSADVFISSSNAVSTDGALVNIDGDGNRVAALSFGPRRVFLFIGRNKLCEGLDAAIHRARNVAAASLAMQLGLDTPCAKTGRCHDCASPDRICRIFSTIERCEPAERIHLLLINEDLGL
jgi:hypothetical protein